MVSLTDRYQPKRVSDFAGISRAKALMSHLVQNPRSSAWLFTGIAGTGKTTLALAVAAELNAELHHIPAASCNLETIQRVCEACYYAPMFGGDFHLVLIDECDRASAARRQYGWCSCYAGSHRRQRWQHPRRPDGDGNGTNLPGGGRMTGFVVLQPPVIPVKGCPRGEVCGMTDQPMLRNVPPAGWK